MPYSYSNRLTALDNSFLDLETPNVHMHVGSVGIFEPGPLFEEGGLDFEQVIELAEGGLRRAPRFRQKLAYVPVTGHPVWVDDERFNLLYHVRHTSLPLPGDDRQLKRLVGRIMSEKLDRSKPMWELWFVEGLENGGFAVVSKVHHCLIDGISGVDLLGAFMGPDSEYRAEPGDHRWIPRPAPGPLSLLSDEVTRRASLPFRMMREGAKWIQHPVRNSDRALDIATGLAKTLSGTMTPATETPFNVEIGPHRRFDWTRLDMSGMREVEARFGGTLNDVALACVAGAVRSRLEAAAFPLDDIDFRVMVPVSTRSEEQRGRLGNRVSLLVVPLPLAEKDPRVRYEGIVAETRKLKQSSQVAGAEALEELSDQTTSSLLSSVTRLAVARRTFNMVVTNVPGPKTPIYLAGARMLASYPLVPLYGNQGLGIALFSYDNVLHWGFNSDWDAIPDLHEFVLAVERELEALRKL